MISNKYNCIFVEVPKTGSTSIRKLLGSPKIPHLGIWEIRRLMLSELSDSKSMMDLAFQSSYKLIPPRVRGRIGLKRFEVFFKFGFVRNPWDRAVSLYMRNEGIKSRDLVSFEEFIRNLYYSSATSIHPSPHVNQLDWYVDPNGQVIVDYIGKFETLQQDWLEIASRIGRGLPLQLPLTKANSYKKKDYTQYYSDAARRIVAKRFERDIEYFKYSFDNV